MRAKHRQYTYRITTRGIDYLTNRTPSLNTSVPKPYGQDWSIRRRHDTKTAPYNFEIWVNDTLFVARYTAATIRRWRQCGYIVPHVDMWRKHIRYTEALLSKTSISKEEQ